MTDKKQLKNARIRAARATPEGLAARRDIELRSAYGISLEHHTLLLKLQDNSCAICKEPFTPFQPNTASGGRKPPCVDHVTGKVRGLLCRGCNTSEGWVAKQYANLQAYLAAPPAEILDLA